MTKHINFSVEKFDVLEENKDSQFATARIIAFSSGPNRNNIICTDETLQKTADTLYSKPVLYNINTVFNDFGTHTDPEDSLIAGFIVDGSGEFIRQEDNRLSFSVLAKIWKMYSPKAMQILERDGWEKKMSVEIDLYEGEDMPDDTVEMKDFAYTGICILGDLVSEGSQGAKMQVISFAEQNQAFKEAYRLEFARYEDINFAIPPEVKQNAEKGLKYHKELGKGSSVSLSVARHLSKNAIASHEKVRHIAKTFKSSKFNDMKKSPPSEEYITFLQYGGNEGKVWSQEIATKLEDADNKYLSYFDKKDIIVENEKKEEIIVDDEVKEMAADPEKEETPEEEKQETPEEEAKEEKDKTEMSNDANLDVAAALAFLEKETESYQELVAEFSETGGKNFAKLAYALLKKAKFIEEMCNTMSAEKEEFATKFAEADEKSKAYMAENEELKKFKADVEQRQFMFEVETTMAEIKNAVEMPKEEMAELVEESKNFSLNTVDAWKNMAKSKAFGFAAKSKKSEGDVAKYALPWAKLTDQPKKSIWDNLK